jgi:hypothetical protein
MTHPSDLSPESSFVKETRSMYGRSVRQMQPYGNRYSENSEYTVSFVKSRIIRTVRPIKPWLWRNNLSRESVCCLWFMVCICIIFISIICIPLSYEYHKQQTNHWKHTFCHIYFCFSIIYSLVCAYFERYTSFSSAACSTWYDIRYTMRSKRLLLCYDDHHNMRRIKAKQDIQLLLLNKCDSGKTLPVLCSDNWDSFA